MDTGTNDLLEQLDRHLASATQSWLLGAGISKNANIPLMIPLTKRVLALAEHLPGKDLLDSLIDELPDGAHVEHILSHLGDYATLADRSRTKKTCIRGDDVSLAELTEIHRQLLEAIAKTVRWGFQSETNEAGQLGRAITEITEHSAFVSALFGTAQAGLWERRGSINLFTTNYDTLLEDALSLASVSCWDGFSGGATAFRNHRFGDPVPDTGYRAFLVKLHGSIDWHQDPDGRVWRVRDGDTYPATDSRVLIYPQATKYHATQRDPFAAQFELLRHALNGHKDGTFSVCGYSFGDDHINQEIELAMARPESKTTLIAFQAEGNGLPEALQCWRSERWGERLFCVTERGLYVGRDGPYFEPTGKSGHDWWTFKGVSALLRDGAEGCVR